MESSKCIGIRGSPHTYAETCQAVVCIAKYTLTLSLWLMLLITPPEGASPAKKTWQSYVHCSRVGCEQSGVHRYVHCLIRQHSQLVGCSQ